MSTLTPLHRLAFAQLDFAHALGPVPGRYVVDAGDIVPPAPAPDPATGIARASSGGHVLAIDVVEAPQERRGRRGRRQPGGGSSPVLRVRLVASTTPLAQRDAEAWRARCAEDPLEMDRWIAAAVDVLNLAVRAHRLAVADPYCVEVTPSDAMQAGVGIATGEQIARGEVVEIITARPREGRSRDEELRSGAAVADALAGRVGLSEAHDVALRALLDLRHGRPRAARAGLRVACELAVGEGVDVPAESVGAAERADDDSVGAALQSLVRALARRP